MSEQALTIAIRAEEAAKSAHNRLDRMNGSLDRLGREVGDLRGDLAAFRTEVLSRLTHEDGVQVGAAGVKKSILDKNRWVVGLAVAFISSGTFVLIATYLLRK